VAFTPDGRRVVSGSDDGAVKIWDAVTGRELLSLVDHRDAVNSVAVSPNGKLVASTGRDGIARVWESSKGQLLYRVAGIEDSPNGVAFSPGGGWLALAGLDNTVLLCDAATGKQLGRWRGHDDRVNGIAFSPDGKLLASASADKTVKLWDLELGKLARPLTGHKQEVTAVAFSPDGKLLASADLGAVIEWDPATGSEVRKHKTDAYAPVTGVSFSPDGGRLVWVGKGGTARISESGADKATTVLYGPGGILFGGMFSPDGTRLVLGSEDGSALVWDLTVEDDALSCRGSDEALGLETLAQSPDGRWLAHAGGKSEVWLRDALTGRAVQTFRGHSSRVQCVAFSPDGLWLVSGGKDKTLKLWEVHDGRERLEFSAPPSGTPLCSLVYDPRGRFVAASYKGGAVQVWDPRTGREVTSLRCQENRAYNTCLAVSPDGSRLTAGTNDEVRLWDTTTWKTVRTWAGHGEGPLTATAYAPDNVRVAVGAGNGMIFVHDEHRDEALLKLTGHHGIVTGMAFSPDGRRLASVSFDKTVRLWDTDTGQPLMSLRDGLGVVTSVVFSPDGRRLAARHGNGVRIWFATGLPRAGDPFPEWRLHWYRRQASNSQRTRQPFALAFHCSRLLEAGNEYFTDSELEQAEADLTLALKSTPRPRDALLSRGAVRARLGRWAEASDDYSQALELSDQGAAAWRLRGQARAELGQWDKAVVDLTQAVERAPTGRRERSYLAVAHLGRGDLPAYRLACVSAYERLHQSDTPNDWNSLSWICSLTGDAAVEPARLVQLMDRAVAAEPKTYAFLNTRGVALYRAGRYEDAVRQLTDAVALHGERGSFEDWVFLAMARSRLGKADQAREDLAQAVKLYDEHMKPAKPGSKPPDWSVRVEWQLLRKEAEELIEGGNR
jgi:WD40 repeat protein/Tfp pilus assembly protein PilF